MKTKSNEIEDFCCYIVGLSFRINRKKSKQNESKSKE